MKGSCHNLQQARKAGLVVSNLQNPSSKLLETAPPPIQPSTKEGADYLRHNQAVVEDVVRFFLYAPPTCIRDVRDLLLRQGFELQYGFSPAYIIEAPEL